MSLLTVLCLIYFAFKIRAAFEDTTPPTPEQIKRTTQELRDLGIKL